MSERKNSLHKKAEPLPMPPSIARTDSSVSETKNSFNVKIMRGAEPLPVPLRPHHLLCTEFFRGYGYSDDFTANMSSVIAELNAADPAVRLSADTDIVCGKCPHNRNGRCDTYEKVLRYDHAVLELLGLRENTLAHWSELKRAAREKIISADKLCSVCGDCQWFDICGK